MVKNRPHSRGYSLIEMMMVVVIIGLVVVIGPLLVTNIVRFYQLHNAKIEIQRDARVCLDIMNRFIRQAVSYTVVVDQVTGQPPCSRISFTTQQGQNISF